MSIIRISQWLSMITVLMLTASFSFSQARTFKIMGARAEVDPTNKYFIALSQIV